MISPHFELTGHEAKGLLYGLLEVNKQQLRENPGLPSMRELIRQGKVRYEVNDPDEHWQTYREMVENVQKYGFATADCEDLAPAVAAEDQIRSGVQSLPYAYSPKEGLYHVVTAVPTGAAARFGGNWPGAMGAPRVKGYTFIDPSAAAGMRTSFSGVRAKFGSLKNPGSVGNDASPVLFSAFLEGLGLNPRDVNSAAMAKKVGQMLNKGAAKAGAHYAENLGLEGLFEGSGSVAGKAAAKGAGKAAAEGVDEAAEDAFGSLAEDAAHDVLSQLRSRPAATSCFRADADATYGATTKLTCDEMREKLKICLHKMWQYNLGTKERTYWETKANGYRKRIGDAHCVYAMDVLAPGLFDTGTVASSIFAPAATYGSTLDRASSGYGSTLDRASSGYGATRKRPPSGYGRLLADSFAEGVEEALKGHRFGIVSPP